MKILIFLKTQQNLKKKNLGGIEALNVGLYNYLKKKYSVKLCKKLNKFEEIKKWDIVISSNYIDIFKKIKSSSKILWVHNKLNLEKIFRKDNFFYYLKFNYKVVFVSNFIQKKITCFPLAKKYMIHNFLDESFENVNVKKKRYKIFIYSVHRIDDLLHIIQLWKKSDYILKENLKLYIFGRTIKYYSKKDVKILKKYKIYFFGNVNKSTLIKYYTCSMAMFCLGKDETFCLNALEGLSCGLPIISFKNTAINEIVNSKYNFNINKFDDIENILKMIVNFNKEKRKKISFGAKKNSNKYSRINICKKWDDLLKK